MSASSNGRRVRRRKCDWLALFEAHSRSGLSQLQFCKQHDVSTAAFYNARSRYLTRLQSTDDTMAVGDFLSLGLPGQDSSGGWDIELSLGADVVLRIRRP